MSPHYLSYVVSDEKPAVILILVALQVMWFLCSGSLQDFPVVSGFPQFKYNLLQCVCVWVFTMIGILWIGVVAIIDFGKFSAIISWNISSAFSFSFLFLMPEILITHMLCYLVLSYSSWMRWFSFLLFVFQLEPFGGIFISFTVFSISRVLILFFLIIA